jgi:Uma2 family endonuclease
MQLDTMLTVDEYSRLPRERDHRLELNRGLLVRRPHPSVLHAETAARIYEAFCRYAASAGGWVAFHARFLLQEEPPTVRAPDVAFLACSRVLDGLADNVHRGAPDLAVEIAGPVRRGRDAAPERRRPEAARPEPQAPVLNAFRAELFDKAFEYLETGAAAVWLVDRAGRTISVYERAKEPQVYHAGHIIRCGSVLPGFEHPVASLLP